MDDLTITTAKKMARFAAPPRGTSLPGVIESAKPTAARVVSDQRVSFIHCGGSATAALNLERSGRSDPDTALPLRRGSVSSQDRASAEGGGNGRTEIAIGLVNPRHVRAWSVPLRHVHPISPRRQQDREQRSLDRLRKPTPVWIDCAQVLAFLLEENRNCCFLRRPIERTVVSITSHVTFVSRSALGCPVLVDPPQPQQVD
jgi:hypothetical protein